MERSKVIFGNKMSDSAYRKAVKGKEKFIKKYGSDMDRVYHLSAAPHLL
ncbi:hypothetical protein [Ruminococcus sp.]